MMVATKKTKVSTTIAEGYMSHNQLTLMITSVVRTVPM